MKSEAEEERSETARLSSFVGAIAVGDLVRSTLGPRGMDKILVSMGRNEGEYGGAADDDDYSLVIMIVVWC